MTARAPIVIDSSSYTGIAPTDRIELATHGFTYRLRRQKLRQVFRREGRYLLRSNMTSEDPAELWRHYMQLTEIEQAFKEPVLVIRAIRG